MNRKERLLYQMLRIRRVEEAIADEYSKQEMRCPIHLSIGQEAIPVGVSEHLTTADRVFSTHRCHAHYLAKGGSLNGMIAELYGRSTGCNQGKGGSMHLVDVSVGMMGGSALVGGSIPLALGSAMAAVFEKSSRVAVAYLGDGGTEEGIFYECLNIAALKKLPVLFIVENNFYATYSHQSSRQATPWIFRRGESFGVPGFKIDGNDVLEVSEFANEAVARARKGLGPTLIEAVTYRYRDHVGPSSDVAVGYRTQLEVDAWLEKCPIKKLVKEVSPDTYLQWQEDIRIEIVKAFEFAKTSPFPKPMELERNCYA